MQLSLRDPTGACHLVVLAKRTYALERGRLVLAREQVPIRDDLVFDGDELLHDTDTVPMKLRTDLVIQGHAYGQGRRQFEARVSVNGKVKMTLPLLIDPSKDQVEVDGEPVKVSAKQIGKRLYILINKPKGVYSTNVAQGEQTRVIDLLPPDLPGRVYPVGRLDAESKGLLLMTNDGELTNHLTHPRYGVPKTYKAVVDGYVTGEAVDEMAKGIWLSDERTGQGVKAELSNVKIVTRGNEKSTLEITLREGRNRQVRRMLARIGHKVRDLTSRGEITAADPNPIPRRRKLRPIRS